MAPQSEMSKAWRLKNKDAVQQGAFDKWYNEIKEGAKGITDENFDEGLEEIIAQLESGDYSSLGPELQKEIEERERREKQEKKKKAAKPKGKRDLDL